MPGRIVTVAYEELVGDPEAVLPPLVASLGLGWEPAVLGPGEGQFISTISNTQVRDGIHQGNQGHWRNYSDHLEVLRKHLASNSIDAESSQ